jgi:tmRNA-binding protein
LSNNLNEQDILSEIARLNEVYKESSLQLVGCKSFSKEQKIKIQMNECDVKRRVLKRKLDSLQRAEA